MKIRNAYVKLILCIICAGMLTNCANTYNRAAKHYSGERHETTSFCQVQLVYDKRDQILADEYINEYNLQYYGSTNFDASTKFSKKHIAKLCRKLGGVYAVATHGSIFSESEFAITNNAFYYNTETRRELTVRIFGH